MSTETPSLSISEEHSPKMLQFRFPKLLFPPRKIIFARSLSIFRIFQKFQLSDFPRDSGYLNVYWDTFAFHVWGTFSKNVAIFAPKLPFPLRKNIFGLFSIRLPPGVKNTGTATMCKGVSLKSPRSPLRSGSLGPLTGLPCILTRFKYATAVSDWVGHDSSGSISLRLGSAELLLVLRAIKVRKAF